MYDLLFDDEASLESAGTRFRRILRTGIDEPLANVFSNASESPLDDASADVAILIWLTPSHRLTKLRKLNSGIIEDELT